MLVSSAFDRGPLAITGLSYTAPKEMVPLPAHAPGRGSVKGGAVAVREYDDHFRGKKIYHRFKKGGAFLSLET